MRTTVVLAVVSLLWLSGCTEQGRSARMAPAGSAPQTQADSAWSIQVVETTGPTGLGISTSLALDGSGYPHISYGDPAQETLKYAAWNGSSWDIQTVDSTNLVSGGTSLVLDSSGHPHICYSGMDTSGGSVTGPGGMKITYGEAFVNCAVWNGSSWDIETVADPGSPTRPSLALDSTGNPHVGYASAVMKYAVWTGASWDTQLVDNAGGPFPSLALDTSDHPHIAYGTNGGELKYAFWDGTSWQVQTVDPGPVGSLNSGFTSLVLDSEGRPHISYLDAANVDLKYADYDGSAWQIGTVDSEGPVGEYASLALDSSGRPHISYSSTFKLKYAAWNGSSWDIQVVDKGGGEHTSLAIDGDGHAHISYRTRMKGHLKYATNHP